MRPKLLTAAALALSLLTAPALAATPQPAPAGPGATKHAGHHKTRVGRYSGIGAYVRTQHPNF